MSAQVQDLQTQVITYTAPVVAEASEYIETIDQKIARYALVYKVSEEEMRTTIKCESKFNPTAWNKTDPHGGAKGLCQFLQPTFDYYSKKAGIENPDIWNVDHQLQTMAYMFSIGEAKQWVCYRMFYTSEKG